MYLYRKDIYLLYYIILYYIIQKGITKTVFKTKKRVVYKGYLKKKKTKKRCYTVGI